MPEGSAWLPMAGIRARGAGAPGQAARTEVGAPGGRMCERGAPLQAASRTRTAVWEVRAHSLGRGQPSGLDVHGLSICSLGMGVLPGSRPPSRDRSLARPGPFRQAHVPTGAPTRVQTVSPPRLSNATSWRLKAVKQTCKQVPALAHCAWPRNVRLIIT